MLSHHRGVQNGRAASVIVRLSLHGSALHRCLSWGSTTADFAHGTLLGLVVVVVIIVVVIIVVVVIIYVVIFIIVVVIYVVIFIIIFVVI